MEKTALQSTVEVCINTVLWADGDSADRSRCGGEGHRLRRFALPQTAIIFHYKQFNNRTHIKSDTRNEISRFSPPQISMPLSYCPRSLKYCLFIANNPPAIVGDLEKDHSLSSFNRTSYLLFTKLLGLWDTVD